MAMNEQDEKDSFWHRTFLAEVHHQVTNSGDINAEVGKARQAHEDEQLAKDKDEAGVSPDATMCGTCDRTFTTEFCPACCPDQTDIIEEPKEEPGKVSLFVKKSKKSSAPAAGTAAAAGATAAGSAADAGAPASGTTAAAGAPAAGTTADAGAPASGTPAGAGAPTAGTAAGAPATVTAANASAPATGTPAGAGAPATVTAADAGAPATGTPAAAQESTVAAAFCDVGADPKAGPGAPPALPAPSLDALCAAAARAPGMVRTRSLCAA
jgi:hypothetical protein